MTATLRRLVSIARTDLRIELMDRSSWLFYLFLPLVFTAILGSATGGSGSGVGVTIVDLDGTPISGTLVTALRDQGGLVVTIGDPAGAAAAGERRLTIPAGFGDGLTAGHGPALDYVPAGDAGDVAVQQSVAAAAGQVVTAVTSARLATEQAEAIRPFASADARAAFFARALTIGQALAAAPRVTSTVTTAPEAASIASGYSQQSPGELVTWTLITLLGVSEIFVSERAAGTLRRLLITPTRRSTIVLGKFLGRYALGLLQMAILIVVGALVFGVPWGRSPVALAMVVLAFALAAVALGMLLGTVARTRQQALQLTILSSMMLAALGGAWFPLEMAPDALRTVASFLPTAWAMSAFGTVILQGGGPPAVLAPVAELVAFAVACFSLANWRLRLT